jgi:mannosyltransferase OCH1-like enzyme
MGKKKYLQILNYLNMFSLNGNIFRKPSLTLTPKSIQRQPIQRPTSTPALPTPGLSDTSILKKNLELKQKNAIEESKRKFYSMPYIISKKHYFLVIPLTIYQTWYTKDLPPNMQKNVEQLKQQNPEFSYELYDDNDCREFIRINFAPDVLHAYDMLIPGAYKADLWRYCVLYKNGGIYMDIKLSCVNGFKLIELCESEHYGLDREGHNNINMPIPIYNALMVCKKNNPFLLEAIHKIVKNVKIKYYGFNALYPTGPGMLSEVIQEIKMKGVNPNLNTDIYHYYDGTGLVYRDRFIISLTYPGYRNDQAELNKKINKKTYTNHWLQNNIYANTEEAK